VFRRSIAVSVVAAFALGGAALASARTDAAPMLQGTVGPGFTISLKQNGKRVTTLKAGKYLFVISDKAAIHNFTLQRGKGGGKPLSSVSFVGTKKVLVTLTKGKWKYYCTPHESIMFGFFTVK
jgi:plastocyanin